MSGKLTGGREKESQPQRKNSGNAPLLQTEEMNFKEWENLDKRNME